MSQNADTTAAEQQQKKKNKAELTVSKTKMLALR